MNDSYVFDTSAIIAFVQDEPGAQTVQQLLDDALGQKCISMVSFITIAEMYYIMWQEQGESTAKELIARVKSLPISIIDSNERLSLTAGRIKASYRVSLGDAFIAATAIQSSAVLVHKDPEFDQIRHLVSMERLPYKEKKRKG